MIEEAQRDYALYETNTDLEETIDANQTLSQKGLFTPEETFDEKLPEEQTLKVSRFFVELFICSLLLWSLLFIKQSFYGDQCTETIKQVLEQNIENTYIQDFVQELEVAIKQIL